MKNWEYGFTLIELLVVIIILGVIASLMLPIVTMSTNLGTETKINRLQTDTLQWYRELAKAKAISESSLTNESENTSIGNITITYETRYINNSPYIIVTPQIANWAPIFIVSPIHTNVTTRGIYVQITSPNNYDQVNPGETVDIVVDAFYVENGTQYYVDYVEILVDGISVGYATNTGSYTYTYPYVVPNDATGDLEITAQAVKGSLMNNDNITLLINEPRNIAVNITSPPDGSTYYPDETIIVTVDSYVTIGSNIQGVEPNVTIGGNTCTLDSNSGYTYTFICIAPTSPGAYTILAQASYGSLYGEDSISIDVIGTFRIVDIVENPSPSEVDEILPACVSTATGNYIVVKVDNSLEPLWNSIQADYIYLGNTYTENASNAYPTGDGLHYYVFIPIPNDLKNVWVPLTTVNVRAYIASREDIVDLIRCCEGTFSIKRSITAIPDDQIEQTTGTVLTITTINNIVTGNICGTVFDDTNIFMGDVPDGAYVLSIKIEKLPSSTEDKVYIAEWRKVLWFWFKNADVGTSSTEMYPVYTRYRITTSAGSITQNVSGTGDYTYVIFNNVNDYKDNITVESFLGNDDTTCPWCELHLIDYYTAHMGYKYETLQRYTVWFSSDLESGLRISPIMEVDPKTACTYNLENLTIKISKDNYVQFYTSKCGTNNTLFTVYLSNENSYNNYEYVIDIFQQGTNWRYSIQNRNCSTIATIDIPNSDIYEGIQFLEAITLRDIPLNYISNLNRNSPFYSWVEFHPYAPEADNTNVTLTITATYSNTP